MSLEKNKIIIIIIERKDLGGVMSKRLRGHLTNAKNSFKTRVQRKVRTEYVNVNVDLYST